MLFYQILRNIIAYIRICTVMKFLYICLHFITVISVHFYEEGYFITGPINYIATGLTSAIDI